MCSADRVQCLQDVTNSDFIAQRNEYVFRMGFLVDFVKPILLKDHRDEPMLSLILNILAYISVGVPMIYALHIYEYSSLFRNMAGIFYVVGLVVMFLERFTLMLHFSSHRSIFHNWYLNQSILWFMCPFFGIPSGVYKQHHVTMHHQENNHDLDISSTEMYQRDSWICFFKYYVRFFILIWVELPKYTFGRKYKTFEDLFGVSIVLPTYFGFQLALMRYVSVGATFWCFTIMHVIMFIGFAFGNWSQHIFIDPEDKDSNHALTYNCIDSAANQRTFNDGYHIVHHINGRLHWSEMPKYFYDNVEEHHKKGALTFRQIDFFEVGILVMTKRLHQLVKNHYVHLGSRETAPTVDEVVANLRCRLVPIVNSK